MAVGTLTQRHGTLKLKDATGTPIEITLGPLASFAFDGIKQGFSAVTTITNRGRPVERVLSAREPVTGSIGLKMQAPVTHASTKTTLDAVIKAGAFGSGVTQDPGGEVWATDIEWTTSRSVGGVTVATVLTFSNAHLMLSGAESLEGNDYTISFEANGLDGDTAADMPLILS